MQKGEVHGHNRSTSKISSKWVRQTRQSFLQFLQAPHFPPVEHHGQRGKTFAYPAWLIMLIGVLAVKCKEPTYLGIHRMTCRLWHAKHKAPGLILEGLRGVDQEATWRKSHRDGWVYGHGSFCLVSHSPCVLGAFTSRRNSAHEAKHL